MRLSFPLLCFCCCFILICCKGPQQSETPVIAIDIPVFDAQPALKIPALLGEGAFWDYRNNWLFWVDIEGKQVNMYDPLTGQNRAIPVPSRVGTVVPQTDSTAVVALEDGVYLLNLIKEELSLISDVEADIPTNRFNDGKVDPLGNLWVGSMRLDESAPTAALYRVDYKGTTTKMLTGITISNGIVWSADKRTMYYIDTPTGKIRAFDFDPDKAAISNERTVVDVAPELGYPDGMTIDENDHLWVALWNGNAVACFDPDSGELIGKIAVPAHNVTSCAFGGPNLDLLYITTASIDMTPQEIDNYPMAGSVFVVSPGVKGVKGTFFGGP